jgi:hypothetical protein
MSQVASDDMSKVASDDMSKVAHKSSFPLDSLSPRRASTGHLHGRQFLWKLGIPGRICYLLFHATRFAIWSTVIYVVCDSISYADLSRIMDL